MSQAKRIRLANSDNSERPLAPSSADAKLKPGSDAEPSANLLELVQDCTCPVCKEIYTEPVIINACGHTFCHGCYDKLVKKCATVDTGSGSGFAFLFASASMSVEQRQQHRRVACPVCRVKFRPCPEAVRPDQDTDCLVRALALVKSSASPSTTVDDGDSGCCSAVPDCWRRRAVRCTDCGVAACQTHHEASLAGLRQGAADIVAASVTFASDDAAGVRQLRRLADMQRRLPDLRRALADRLAARLDAYEARLADASNRVRLAADASDHCRRSLADLAELLTSATDAAADNTAGDSSYAEMLTLKNRLGAELAEARSKHPLLRVEESNEMQEELERRLDECLDGLTVRLYALPYESIAPSATASAAPSRLTPVSHRRTQPRRPWCIRLLSNTAGLRLSDGRLVKSSPTVADSNIVDNTEALPEAGVLLVNYSGPNSRLLVFEAGSLRRIGCLQLQPPRLPGIAIGFASRRRCRPGRIAVCNRRQMIFATDSGNSRVMAFQPNGRLTASFGCFGDIDDENSLCRDADRSSMINDGEPVFQRPLGLCVDEKILYVVDSGNCRVQMFDLDDNYKRVGCLKHSTFTSGLHSVLAVASSDLTAAGEAAVLVVSDRDTESLFLFDRTSRRLIRSLGVDGRPADLCSDRHGNILVSMAASRLVMVFDPQLTRCLYNFNLDSWSPTSNDGLLHGSPGDVYRRAATAAADNDDDGQEEDEEVDEDDEYIAGWDSSASSASSAASSGFSLSAADPPLPSVGDFLFSGLDGRSRHRFVAGFGAGGSGGGISGLADCLQGIALDPVTRRLFATDSKKQCLLAYQL